MHTCAHAHARTRAQYKVYLTRQTVSVIRSVIVTEITDEAL